MEVYPNPVAPSSPVLSWAALAHKRTALGLPCVQDVGATRLLTSGRMAIGWITRLLGLGPADEVLVPAYHCHSMVAPVEWSGATPVFYRIAEADAAIELDDVRARIGPRTRALIATHYFGFPQHCDALRQLCDTHGIALIEDCAHAFFGAWQNRPLGSFGDYAIASPMKFFPLFDGGCLVSARHALDAVQLRPGGRGLQFKALLSSVEKALYYGRLRPLGHALKPALWLKDVTWAGIKQLSRTHMALHTPSASHGGFDFPADWLEIAISRPSARMLAWADRSRIVERRRAHYRYLAQALAGLPGCRALHPELPEHVVPYVFPLLIEDHARVFPALKRQGVPILRWDALPGAAAAVCPVSARFAQALLQFPCHQELRAPELDWMIERIRAAVLDRTDG